MDSDIKSQLERAKELKKELDGSAQKDLENKVISDKTRNITQEILVKIRSILDQVMYSFFEKEIAPHITESEKKKARVYFPLVNKEENIDSVLGRAMIKNLSSTHPKIFHLLRSVQPYNEEYKWLNDLSRYANHKHIKLAPQKRVEEKRTTVSSRLGSVSWNSGVTFGKGVAIFGAPIDPVTQNIVPTQEVESKIEIWVSFVFEDSNINALWLCKNSIEGVEKIVSEFFDLF